MVLLLMNAQVVRKQRFSSLLQQVRERAFQAKSTWLHGLQLVAEALTNIQVA
jgi:hypothetical protein